LPWRLVDRKEQSGVKTVSVQRSFAALQLGSRAALAPRDHSGFVAAVEAFAADVKQARLLRIGRFPTFVVHGPAGSRIAVGYRPIEAIETILETVGARPRGSDRDVTLKNPT
jgi:hypothetical protein